MPRLRAWSWKIDRREHVAVLGDRERRHLQLGCAWSSSSSMRHAPSSSEYSCAGGGGRTRPSHSFPLDRRRRLRADVVDHAIDALHLVDDPRRRSSPAARAAAAPSRPSCRRGSRPRGSRSCTRRCARRPSRRRSAPAAAPRSSARAGRTSPPLASPRRRSRRRGAAGPGAPASPRRGCARPGPGPGNGWRHTNSSSRPSSSPTCAHLVLEQLAQRLDQLEPHPLGQAADVVMALDHVRTGRSTDTVSMTSG